MTSLRNIKRNLFKILIVSFIVILISANSFAHLNAQATYNEAQNKIIEAYKSILYAEENGGNITNLANMLNEAVQLLDMGNYYSKINSTLASKYYNEAYLIAENVSNQAPNVAKEGMINQRNAMIFFIFQISLLIVIGYLLYRYLPALYWELWYRTHKNWKIFRLKSNKRKAENKGSSYKVDEQIAIFALIVVIIIGGFLVSNYFLANLNKNPYSSLGILGPNGKIGDYPKNLKLGQNFTLYLYVENEEGHIMYYQVLVKIGNATSIVNQTNYLNVPPIATYSFILLNHQNETRKITLAINVTGENIKLIFELWAYSVNQNSFKYINIWDQLFVNVTA
jgi:Predicted membrane protein